MDYIQANRSRPLRRIPLSRRSHIIGFQRLPSGPVEHESALERDFVTLTSFTEPTVSITSQPVTIHYFDGRTRRRYTPDFLVTGSRRRTELIEIKYDVNSNRERLEPAFASLTRVIRYPAIRLRPHAVS